MKHLNRDFKPLAEDFFQNRFPLLFDDDFATKAKSTADNVKRLPSQLSKARFKHISPTQDDQLLLTMVLHLWLGGQTVRCMMYLDDLLRRLPSTV